MLVLASNSIHSMSSVDFSSSLLLGNRVVPDLFFGNDNTHTNTHYVNNASNETTMKLKLLHSMRVWRFEPFLDERCGWGLGRTG